MTVRGVRRATRRLLIPAFLLLAATAARAEEAAWSASALLAPGAITAGFWGTSPKEAMRRLHIQARPPGERGAPEPYVSGGLAALWRLPPETAAALDWVDVGAGTWMVFYRDRLLAVVAKERMHEWHRLMGSTERRYGRPEPMEAAAPVRSSDTSHVLRGNVWKARGSRIAFFKAETHAPIEWLDPDTGLLVHEEVVEAPETTARQGPHAGHRLHDADLPFYLAVFDARSTAELRAPARRP